MAGRECVRLGLATHLTRSEKIPGIIQALESYQPEGNMSRVALARILSERLSGFFESEIPSNPDMDTWVVQHFSGKKNINDIIIPLRECRVETKICDQVLRSISERSPTALAVTLRLLRHNENRALDEVFTAELKAAQYLTRHPDYVEGIRARIIDRDNKPHWQPDTHDAVDITGLEW